MTVSVDKQFCGRLQRAVCSGQLAGLRGAAARAGYYVRTLNPRPAGAGAPVMTNAMRIIGLAGWSGSGKTTLVTSVIPVLVGRGLKVATVKHAHHDFDTDQPGKDSWLHRQAGASEVAIVSSRRWAIVHELGDEPEPPLAEILAKLSPVDLVIVEGFKRHAHPKLEVFRAAVGKPLLHPDDDCIVAVATDAPLPRGASAGADARRYRGHRQCVAGRGAAARPDRRRRGRRRDGAAQRRLLRL